MALKELIYRGLNNGDVKIIQNPDDDCIVCQIGEYWFCFIDSKYEDLIADEVYEKFTKERLTEMIYSAIMDLDEDERLYYEYFLKFMMVFA